LLALGAGIGFAGVIICLRSLHDQDSVLLIFVAQTASAAVLWLWVRWAGWELEGLQWAWVGALSLFQFTLPYLLFARGLQWVGAHEASLLSLIEPVLNPIWVLLIWGSAIAGHTLVGGGLILAALLLRYLPAKPPSVSAGGAN
jgi:drug/metabolite transporter (DMT)-like permease